MQKSGPDGTDETDETSAGHDRRHPLQRPLELTLILPLAVTPATIARTSWVDAGFTISAWAHDSTSSPALGDWPL